MKRLNFALAIALAVLGGGIPSIALAQSTPPGSGNCRAAVDAFNKAVGIIEQDIKAMEIIYKQQIDTIKMFRDRSSAIQGSHIDQATAYANNAKTTKEESNQTRQYIDDNLKQYREELINLRKGCLAG